MTSLTRRAALALGLAIVAGAAMAAQPDPLATIRALYKGPAQRRTEPFSKRLAALYAAAQKKSKELDEPVAGLDFDYVVAGQDSEPGTYRSAKITLVSKTDTTAKVDVAFKNGGDQEVVYDLVLENGRWVIDEVTSLKGERWVLSKLYAQGAAGE